MKITDWLALFRKYGDIKVFHVNHLKLLTAMNEHALRVALSRLSGNKTIQRICRGFYANPFNMPTLEEISGQIYQPSYISIESALATHGLLSQVPRVLTCVTTQLPRTFRTSFGAIEYHQIKGAYFQGFVRRGMYSIAEKEKALADYLYLTAPKDRQDRLSTLILDDVDMKKAKDYFMKMGIGIEGITDC